MTSSESIIAFQKLSMDMIWLGSGCMLLRTSEIDDWYVVDIARKTKSLLWPVNTQPASIKYGDVFGNSGVVPCEKAVDQINDYLRSGSIPMVSEIPESIRITCQEVDMIPPQSMFNGTENSLSLAVTAWYLSAINHYEVGNPIPRVWTISTSSTELGTFISTDKPIIVYPQEENVIYILVRRWDQGIDAYTA